MDIRKLFGASANKKRKIKEIDLTANLTTEINADLVS